MRSTLGALAALALVAGCKTPDLEEVEADAKELRSELREVREELRSLRAETRELRDRLDEIDDGGGEATADTGPDGGLGVAPLPPLPDGGAPPPEQSNVKISIHSNPSGATVFHEDRKLGRTPLLYQTRPGGGQLMIRIEKPGYRPRLLSLRPDEDAKISVQLAKQ